ncbi:hypothetical protein CRG98_039199 [Punica granatum]|uniref:MBD domain-containing protein n=1 Tax=Punica granatum TaxID=22663 RepID=A0A2I0I8X0_PUNGR|nr:hypothetical protein CRG98_039199 [Punica granatum]
MKQGHSSGSVTDSGNDKGKDKININISPLSMETLSKIKKHIYRRRFRPTGRYFMHDNTSPGYGWLLPGWLAEERHMEYGRVYRYYYDPSGRLYKTRREVLIAWKQSGVIVMDN